MVSVAVMALAAPTARGKAACRVGRSITRRLFTASVRALLIIAALDGRSAQQAREFSALALRLMYDAAGGL